MRSATERFDRLETAVRDILTHLHDPDYHPDELLYDVLGCGPAGGVGRAQFAVTQAIDEMAPAGDGVADSHSRRIYDVLVSRYQLKLTQEETAERLHLSVRHLNRVQREAAHLLARHLWDRWLKAGGPGYTSRADYTHRPVDPVDAAAEPPQWQAQIREEWTSLQSSSGAAVADLAETMAGALVVVHAALAAEGVAVDLAPLDKHVSVAVHPAVLRQILLSLTGALAHGMGSGSIVWRVEYREASCDLVICSRDEAATGAVDVESARALVSLCGGRLSVDKEPGGVEIRVTLPRAHDGRLIVVAADDNVDLLSLFASYCTGTPYRIIPVSSGQQAMEAVAEHHPDIILLDVMLPDIDGWDLLMNLHANPGTRDIPVIVCSVIADEHLVLSLGAVAYLRKPVWRKQLLDALGSVATQLPGVCREAD